MEREGGSRFTAKDMLRDFSFALPTKIMVGKGFITRVGETVSEFAVSNALVVTDKGIRKTNMFTDILESLSKNGIDYLVFDDVRPNPRDSDCEEGARIAAAKKVDIVIAVGGGSSMDSAKAIASLLTNQGPIHEIMKPNKLRNSPLPLVCIPTTAGTGSEVTSFAVLTIEKEKRKSCIFDERVRPKVALLDPDVLKEIPASIAASTGIDALTHAIEAYTCKYSTHITDVYAIGAIKMIARNIRKMVYDRDDDSCEAMLVASLLAGIAFGFSDVAGVHCMAEALGGLYDTPHGVANSIFLPVVFEYNIPADLDKHYDVALALGVDATGKSKRQTAQAAVDELKQLADDLNIPKLLSIENVNPNDFTFLSKICMKNLSAASNPRSVSAELFEELYYRTYNATT